MVIGLVVCLFDWYAYEYVGSPSLFVEPMGSFVGGPPLLYLVEQEFIRVQRIGENQTINVFLWKPGQFVDVCRCLEWKRTKSFTFFVRHDLSVWPRPYMEL